MPRVYMRFEWLAGWRVSFLDGDRVLPRALVVASEDKLFEMAERGGGLSDLATRQALEHGIRLGKGGMYLDLSAPQLQNLQRTRLGASLTTKVAVKSRELLNDLP